MGPCGLAGPGGASLGLTKKIHLIIRPGPGRRSGPVGLVQVCKNLAQTRPVAIPTSNLINI